MDSEYYKKYEPIFNSWHITRQIGEGSYGKVFEIHRSDFGETYKAALKAMTIPSNDSEIKSVMADGMDEKSVRAYYESFVEDIVKEFVLMSKLKGNSHIVSYEDHMVIEHKDKIGWDILIRMELLTPLLDHIRKVTLTRKDVIKLGIDMCKALELCQKYNIIHRDIKPENIFVSENGDYKLGDFGIARTLEQTSGMLSKKGTQTYMAPEVYREENYGSNVDIYSLGIVMYRLLNENRTPFLPAYPAPVKHSDREAAIKKRISGAVIPCPKNADGRLAEIVLKACRYNPKERYFSPMEMREELEAILYNKEEAKAIYPGGDATPNPSLEYVNTGDVGNLRKPEDRTANILAEGSIFEEPYDATEGTAGIYGDVRKDPNKTTGMFDALNNVKKKKPFFKTWLPYAIFGACALAAALIIIAPGKKPAKPIETDEQIFEEEQVSFAVAGPEELTDAVAIQIDMEPLSNEDAALLRQRFESFGKPYYFDETTGSMALSAADLGETDETKLAVIRLLCGKGEITIRNADAGPEMLLKAADVSDAVSKDGTLQLTPADTGAEKLAQLKSAGYDAVELCADEQAMFATTIDDEKSELQFAEEALPAGCCDVIAAILENGPLSVQPEFTTDIDRLPAEETEASAAVTGNGYAVTATKTACSHSKTVKQTTGTSYQQSNESVHTVTETYNLVCADCGATVSSGLSEQRTESHAMSGNSCTKCGYTAQIASSEVTEEIPMILDPFTGNE